MMDRVKEVYEKFKDGKDIDAAIDELYGILNEFYVEVESLIQDQEITTIIEFYNTIKDIVKEFANEKVDALYNLIIDKIASYIDPQ